MDEDKKALFYLQEILPHIGEMKKATTIYEGIDIVAKYLKAIDEHIFNIERRVGK